MVKSTYNRPEQAADDRGLLAHWLEQLAPHYPRDEVARVSQACAEMAGCQGERHGETGETLVRHAVSTADILVGLRLDADTLIAALLDGCLERGALTADELAARFGPGIARMVSDLGRIGQIANIDVVIAAKDLPQHEENLRRLLLGIAEDVRVILVVLAERLHLMRAVKDLEPARRAKIARDTQRVFAPLANRLGVWQVKWELEDLALRYLEPEEYRRIAKLLAERRGEREGYIAAVIQTLHERFAEAGIQAEISGRPKHIYSIWRKMRRKGVDIAEIFDLRAVRIMVQTVSDCYAALGIVHGLWRHIPREFDDYIATPKGNMYQSLHTAVVGPEDKALEVQIRTHEMHRHAELGVAAHWAYKESKGHDAAFQRRVVWMRTWLEHRGEDDTDALERFKTEHPPAHIYVLTPQFKVVELPQGATALDFAYAIHSEVGNRCRGARVNGRIVPLNQALASGDSVEILTQKNAAPSRDWLSPHLGYLRTTRARNRVRQWFKQQHFEQHLHEGRGALERELARLGILEKAQPEALAPKFNFKRGEDLLAAIGRGDLAVGTVARKVGEPRAESVPEKESEPKARPVARHRGMTGGIVVEGVDDLMTHMAQCCKPVPQDPIVGFVTRGRGVTIHRRNCSNVRHLPPEEAQRLIEARWSDQPSDCSYPVDILVIAADRKGLLRDLTAVLSDADVDVVGVETHSEKSTDTASMRFTIEVHDMTQAERLISKLQQLPDVLSVRRSR